MKSNFRRLFLIVLPLLLPVLVAAQTHRASLRGTIYDPNHAAIRGAQIRVTNIATGDVRASNSDNNGEYAISSLPAGEYQVEVEVSNFEKYMRKIELLVNQEQRLDVTLEIGRPSVPEVESTYISELKKDSASLGTVIENRQITSLPLDGRNFYELSLLVPGAVPPAPGSAGSVRGDFAFSVNGAREDANNFLLDGVYNTDPKLNTFGVRPSVDAIHEFEMLTSTYDASFGRNPGAQVNV
ncbi:MAG TPA: carboxypeptidase-like regulatory domain-containing protein, partial [Pyrinomonadaceae bacterium]|nr:carboxypeptidase-like regulatory domain-containing protein [Pyrinomonadaceae bacterium]